MNASLQAAAALSRTWVRLYTARLPETLRNVRRAEMDADLWEHQHDRLASGAAAGITATEIVLRTCLGALDDLAWRFEVLRVMRRSSNNGRISMRRFTSRHTQWMGLAGLTVFLMSYRERLGRKGTIGVWLLITSMASFFLANTLLAALPPGTGRNIAGMVLSIGFVILPIPAFILIGLALKGPARAGAFLVAVVGPLGMVLPSILAKFGLENPPWLRGDAPVNLTYGMYFILAAVWLAAAGYSTYRQPLRPV